MTTIDIILLIIIGAGAVTGFQNGFIRQLAAIVGLIAGLLAAKALYTTLAERLCPAITESMTAAQVISFVAIWVIVPLLFILVASMLTKVLEAICLGWINRLLGSVLGIICNLLVVTLLIYVLESIDTHSRLISNEAKQESILYRPLQRGANGLFPAVKDITQQYIQDIKDAARRTQ